MLLLMVATELQNVRALLKKFVIGCVEEGDDPTVDLGAVRPNLGGAGAGDEPALRSRIAGTHGLVVTVEEIRIDGIDRFIVRVKHTQQEGFEEPRDMCAMPFRWAHIGH